MGHGPDSFALACWVADRPVANWLRCEWAAPRSWPNRRKSPPMTAASRRCFPRNFKLGTAMALHPATQAAHSSEGQRNQTTGVDTGSASQVVSPMVESPALASMLDAIRSPATSPAPTDGSTSRNLPSFPNPSRRT